MPWPGGCNNNFLYVTKQSYPDHQKLFYQINIKAENNEKKIILYSIDNILESIKHSLIYSWITETGQVVYEIV